MPRFIRSAANASVDSDSIFSDLSIAARSVESRLARSSTAARSIEARSSTESSSPSAASADAIAAEQPIRVDLGFAQGARRHVVLGVAEALAEHPSDLVVG
jgi:predicted lipid-binding transport protein (Tim44 family)